MSNTKLQRRTKQLGNDDDGDDEFCYCSYEPTDRKLVDKSDISLYLGSRSLILTIIADSSKSNHINAGI
jgi:hypothetical protein